MPSKISLGDLVKDVANSDANDRETQQGLLNKLQDVKLASRKLNNPELGFMLDAASDLMRYLSEGVPPTAEAMLSMVTRLTVNAECTMYRCMEHSVAQTPEPDGAVQATPTTEQPVRGPLTLSQPKPLPEVDELMLPLNTEEFEMTDMTQMKLGQVLVNLGLVNPEQVFEALDHQQEEKLRVGEALADLGHLVPADLKQALGLQHKMREFVENQLEGDGTEQQSGVEMDEWQGSLLGAVLVANHAITEQELRKGLAIQRATGMRLGEALVHHGLSNWREIRQGIQIQERLRHSTNGNLGMRLEADDFGTWQP